MKVLTEDSIRHAFDRKVKSCKERNISWTIQYEYYRVLMRSRSVMTCFYTNKPFDLRKAGADAYPTLDRIDPSLGYTPENTVFCRKVVNDVKNDYWESGAGLSKGMGEQQVWIYRSIEKVMKQSELQKERMKPYQEFMEKVDQRKQEQEEKVELKEKLTEERKEIQRQQKIKERAKEQRDLAKAYVEVFEQFEKLEVVFEVSIKEFRDMVRITRCKISKVKFDSIWDKHLYVIDKTKPVTKENLLIVKKNVQEALDHLSQGDIMVLKTSMLNALKHI